MQKYQTNVEPTVFPVPPSGNKAHLHTITAGAVLPLIQAGVTAIAAGILTVIILAHSGTYVMLQAAGIVVIVVFIAAWLFLERHWLHETQDRIVQQFALEPEPVRPEPQTLRVEITDRSNGGYHQHLYDFPATPEQMTSLAAGINSGTGFPEAYWIGAGAPFSQAEYRKLIAFLLKEQLIEQAGKAKNQGYRLTDDGQAIFERLAPPPPPELTRLK